MKTEIESAIKILAQKAKTATAPHEAMQFAQAALNLAHTQQVMKQVELLK